MADYSVDVHNAGAVAVDSDVHVNGLDDIRAQTTLAGETTLHSDSSVTADTTARLSVEPVQVTADTTGRLSLEPVDVTSSATLGVDLQPVAVDTCLRIELAPPPPTVIRTPWSSRLGFAWLGVEVVAVSLTGELRTHVDPAPRTPQVVGLVEQHAQGSKPAAGKTGVTVRLGP